MPGPQKVVNLQGRDYSTWANTLDTAHEKNQSELTRFLGIETTVLQMPSEQNGYTTIVHARAAWLNADGDRVTFDGIGDANPQSVKSMVAAHAIRFAETRAKGRALRDSVNIGEVLEEELGDEEPAPRQPAPDPQARRPVAMVPQPVDLAALRQQVEAGLAADPDAASKLPKAAAEMTEAEASKTLNWLQRRARMGVTRPAATTTQEQDTGEVDADVGSRSDELTAYVNDVDAHLQSMKGTRGPMTADQRARWASLYTRGQALAGPAVGEDSRPVADLKPTEIATACSRYVQSCLAELAGSEVGS